MNPIFKLMPTIAWCAILLYWTILAIKGGKPAIPQEPWHKRFLLYWLPLLLAFYLLGPGEWFGHSLIRENFVLHNNLVGLIGSVLCIAGAVFAIWARYLLGSNWSIAVQEREGHELVDQGPYRLVRHPIYTGLICLFLGNAFIVGDYRGLIAVAIVSISFWFKLKKEESLLLTAFGGPYQVYMRSTKALVPWVL